MIRQGNFTFFYGKGDVLSNWHPSTFTYKGITFTCVEQFMMYCKAKLFNDEVSAGMILETDDPAKQKYYGRRVRNFNQVLWDTYCRTYVFVGNREKYSQNPQLLSVLLSTKGTHLVEASPNDRIWGIGMAYNDPDAMYPERWRGMNWLGDILTKLRDTL